MFPDSVQAIGLSESRCAVGDRSAPASLATVTLLTAHTPTPCAVALFNASDDTVEMVLRMLAAADIHGLAGCHFADLKKGNVDFVQFLAKYDPQVVIFDISPPYAENWHFFNTLRNVEAMDGRGLASKSSASPTTCNKSRPPSRPRCERSAWPGQPRLNRLCGDAGFMWSAACTNRPSWVRTRNPSSTSASSTATHTSGSNSKTR